MTKMHERLAVQGSFKHPTWCIVEEGNRSPRTKSRYLLLARPTFHCWGRQCTVKATLRIRVFISFGCLSHFGVRGCC